MEPIITLAAIYGIMAMAVQLAASTGHLSFGHAALAGVGGYTAALLHTHTTVPFVLSVVAAALCAGLIALVFALGVGRLGHLFFALTTLAIGELLAELPLHIPALGGVHGIKGVSLKVSLSSAVLMALVFFIVLTVWERSPTGRRVRSAGFDDSMAAAVGLSVFRARVLVFATSGAIAGIGGAFMVHYLGLVAPHNLRFHFSLVLVIFATVGGIQSAAGALLGASLLTALPEVLRFAAVYRPIIYGVLVVIVLLVRPVGILPFVTLPRVRYLVGRLRTSGRGPRPGQALGSGVPGE